MAKGKKKSVRAEFRREVFARDYYKCKVCGRPGLDRQGVDGGRLSPHMTIPIGDLVELDAHHITPRKEMPNGGYVKENGITLCSDCHLKAEEMLDDKSLRVWFGFSPDDLYKLIGSSEELAWAASERLGDDQELRRSSQ